MKPLLLAKLYAALSLFFGMTSHCARKGSCIMVTLNKRHTEIRESSMYGTYIFTELGKY